MASTAKLEAYLALERHMLELDTTGDATADVLRDLMDPLWYALDDADRDYLNQRPSVDLARLYPICFFIGNDLYLGFSEETASEWIEISNQPVAQTFRDWEFAA